LRRGWVCGFEALLGGAWFDVVWVGGWEVIESERYSKDMMGYDG
jgi:hypothetical protein